MSNSALYGIGASSVSSSSFQAVVRDYAPSTTDVKGPNGQFFVGQSWVDKTTNLVYVLTSFSSSQGVVTANWEQLLSSSIAGISTLTGDSGGALSPVLGNINIVGGTNTTVAGAGNTLTINVSVPSSITWQAIGANQTLVINNGYFCTAGGALSLALPAVSAVGDTIIVSLDGSTSWTITQPNAGSQIRLGSTQTTLGVGGSLASTAVGDTVTLVCETANARWVVTDVVGNITIV